MIYPPGEPSVTADVLHVKRVRAALKDASPPGARADLTGQDALYQASGQSGTAPSVLTEALIAGLGALVILVFVFGTLPAVAMPMAVAVAAILNIRHRQLRAVDASVAVASRVLDRLA
jgi:RND superfamily putative drug exporter